MVSLSLFYSSYYVKIFIVDISGGGEMKIFSKKLIILILILSLVTPVLGVNQSLVFAEPTLDIQAKSAILVDAQSGRILYSQNPDEPLPPASMTKMMTEYLLLDAINSGKASWDDVVTASEYAHWMGKYGGSRVYLAQGEQRTVRELMYAMAVYSANDATVALAEYVAGSETNFVNLMNEKAAEFGMTETHFLTSTGYPVKDLENYAPNVEGEHLMSTRDAATLAYYLVNDYPEIFNFTSTPTLNFREGELNELKNLPNWNWMLPGVVKAYEYNGLDGLKTGYTEEAGYNFTGTAERDGFRLISVVSGTSSMEQRFVETKKLLDYGFSNYEAITLVEAKEAVVGYETVPVKNGKETEVSVISKNDLEIVVRKGEQDLYQTAIVLNETITAPIKSEDQLGKISYEYLGQEQFDYLNEEVKLAGAVDLIAEEDVEKANPVRLFFRKIINIFKDIYNGIVN